MGECVCLKACNGSESNDCLESAVEKTLSTANDEIRLRIIFIQTAMLVDDSGNQGSRYQASRRALYLNWYELRDPTHFKKGENTGKFTAEGNECVPQSFHQHCIIQIRQASIYVVHMGMGPLQETTKRLLLAVAVRAVSHLLCVPCSIILCHCITYPVMESEALTQVPPERMQSPSSKQMEPVADAEAPVTTVVMVAVLLQVLFGNVR